MRWAEQSFSIICTNDLNRCIWFQTALYTGWQQKKWLHRENRAFLQVLSEQHVSFISCAFNDQHSVIVVFPIFVDVVVISIIIIIIIFIILKQFFGDIEIDWATNEHCDSHTQSDNRLVAWKKFLIFFNNVLDC